MSESRRLVFYEVAIAIVLWFAIGFGAARFSAWRLPSSEMSLGTAVVISAMGPLALIPAAIIWLVTTDCLFNCKGEK